MLYVKNSKNYLNAAARMRPIHPNNKTRQNTAMAYAVMLTARHSHSFYNCSKPKAELRNLRGKNIIEALKP